MSEKNIAEMVNVNGGSDTNGDRWMMEKITSNPCTVTPSRLLLGQVLGQFEISQGLVVCDYDHRMLHPSEIVMPFL